MGYSLGWRRRRYTAGLNQDASESLREGLEETLTLHRPQLQEILRNSFLAGHLIEPACARGRTGMLLVHQGNGVRYFLKAF